MTKTRHSQFISAFDDFMKTTTIKEYNMDSLTKNQTCRDHNYRLTIPTKTKIYEVRSNDPTVTNEDGYMNQDIPSLNVFKHNLEDHFDPYILIEDNVKMAYIDLTHIGSNTEKIVYFIDVYYYKSHLPFPVKLTKMQTLEALNIQLERKTELLENQLMNLFQQLDAAKHSAESVRRRMRIDRRETKEKYVGLMEKMRQKLIGQYAQCGQQEDCPVCYEAIDASKLKIPTCCHYICTSCADRCSPQQCPLCRVEFA